MIELKDYWMGRDSQYPLALTPAIRTNAIRTVDLANLLLGAALKAGLSIHGHANGSLVSSGWRPPAVNAATPRAAKMSKHLTGEAIDLYDPDDALDAWLMGAGQAELVRLGLWLEHPDATPRWTHVQTRPPGSGNRVFRP